MKPWIVAGIVTALVIAPTASAQSLEQQFSEFRFDNLTFSVGWNSEKNRASVEVFGNDLEIRDEGASQLRTCIDGNDCPMPDLEAAAGGSNRDGRVSSDEVEEFRQIVRLGLAASDDVRDLLQNLKAVIRIDNKSASSISLTDLIIRNAEGSIESTSPIHIYIVITAIYANVAEGKSHRVEMLRGQSDFTIAEKIIIKGGKNWRLVESSIEPASMQAYFGKGRLEGTQDEFESSEPLVFTIEHHKSSPGWGLLGALAALGAAMARRRKL